MGEDELYDMGSDMGSGAGSGMEPPEPDFCRAVLYVDPNDTEIVGENLLTNSYTQENISEALEGTSNHSWAYFLPNISQDVSDVHSEAVHNYDSAALLVIMALLFLTVITIWVFKVRRLRVLHSTGLSIIYGIVVGVILKYYMAPTKPTAYNIIEQNCSSVPTFEIGRDIQLNTAGDNFTCQILGKVFTDEEGNYIEQTLLFDPELFFFALLPPIIFYAGYSLQKRHFFRNLGSLLLYAFAGTIVSTFVIGGLMYGYSVSGAETKGSFFANQTGNFVPNYFRESVIPSLLFGSLISATDPVTVLAIFHDLHVDHDLYSLVFGESVMNDAVAIVLFRSIAEFGEEENFQWQAIFVSIGSFIGIFLGSFVVGCAVGLVTALLMKFSKLRDYPLLETAMFVIMSYSCYLFAEFAHLTGIVAVLFCGIMQSYYTYINLSPESRRRTKELFELVNFLAENFVFSYMGLSLFTYSNHQWVPGFILFAFVAIFVGRLINIYIFSFVLNLGRRSKIPFRLQHMLVFAGLRGAIAFALAIRNTQSPARQLIFTTTLCIVIVTILFCGGFSTLVLQCLKIQVGVHDDDEGVFEDGHEIEYVKSKGNWFVSKWSKFDKKFLISIFTHHGRPINTFCCNCCLPICSKCKPEDELDVLIEESEDESGEAGSEEDTRDHVLSFRQPQSEDETSSEDEAGDLGLGSSRNDSHHDYNRLLGQSAESTL